MAPFGIIDRSSVLFNPGDWVREKGTERIGEVISVGTKVNLPGYVKVHFLDGWMTSTPEDTLYEIEMDEDSLDIARKIQDYWKYNAKKDCQR